MIAYLVGLVDKTLLNYLETIFGYVSGPLGVLLKAVALVALLFIAVNHVLQLKQVSYGEYITWAIRYFLIAMFALVWGNFSAIYTVITETPGDYSALLVKGVAAKYVTHRADILDVAAIKDEYTAMDAFTYALFWMARDFFRDTSILDIGMSLKNIGLGILMGIIGGVWTAVCAIIIMIAKIGLMMALSLAPLAICMLMVEQTRQYFEAWSRFVLSFLVIPLLLAALTAIVLYVASSLLVESNAGSNNKEAYLMFAVIMIAAFVLLWKLPEMGQAISGSAVGAAGAGFARAMPGRTMSAASSVRSAGRRVRDGAQVANAARKAGASPGRIMWATINGMRQSAIARQNRRDDRLAGRTRGMSGSGTGGDGGGSGQGGTNSGYTSKTLSAARIARDGVKAVVAARREGASSGKAALAGLKGMATSTGTELKRREERKASQPSGGGQPGRAPRRRNSRGTSPEDYEN
ncbi:type IV secretion system protein VirB6 [Rhizobium aethiopicum]|uniref:type IV secretion system protein n=1 Tax=Rhizobium aethiopicum TaxID=1138170 RepID=UPI00160BC279|nr:type IV secretion system protein [Rhizobium aethiopicum]MBB4581582.1 type IV secretion system protein VirB6 [Rhizobium aethiopicum]